MREHDDENRPSELTADDVRAVLGSVRYPGLTRDLVSFGMVNHVSVCGTHVNVRLALRTQDASIPAQLEASITTALRPRDVTTVAVEIVPAAAAPPVARPAVTDPWAGQVRLASVGHMVAVGAGKGGVGKSTVAVNLALTAFRSSASASSSARVRRRSGAAPWSRRRSSNSRAASLGQRSMY